MSVVNSDPLQADMHIQQQKVKVVAGYALQQRLGSGSFATVYKGIKVANPQREATSQDSGDNAEDPKTVAIKAIARTSEKLTKKVLQNLEIEISILRTYRHPNIVCMHNVQKTERHFYLILEYCGGGDVQRLIRTRKSGRLSERLTRRLMRDLASGLKFLWGQELIHRDIKPQNLLLTGALPLDEVNDPGNTAEEDEKRRQIDFPTHKFALKIADFGFARHLQTASLAETLCGSPLYMAPEILQHHRYDAKADLWSVGTVLFEMIAGKPPFNGENHIDLLRNIQRKAVRLPPDVRVTRPCVNLLRLLLHRNPLSRAGFKEFFEACDAFVALGCEGVGTTDSGTCRIPTHDLGTIPENDGATGSDSLMTVATTAQPQLQHNQQQQQQPSQQQPNVVSQTVHPQTKQTHIVSPALVPAQTPPAVPPAILGGQQNLARQYPNRLAPLTQSPPTSAQTVFANVRAPSMPPLIAQPRQPRPQQTGFAGDLVPTSRRADMSQSQASTDESGFVMVEYGTNSRPDLYDQSNLPNPTAQPSIMGQPYYMNTPPPPLPIKNDGGGFRRTSSKGMLSTSPGTGGLLMGLVGRARLGQHPPNPNPSFSEELAAANKMLATAEDVGRRAVSVAHLGDTRAYIGMRLFHMNDSSSSLLSATPMEGVEEEPDEKQSNEDGGSDDSSSTEIMAPARRRSSVSMDRVMMDSKEEQAEEMPFAISPEAQAVALPSRASSVSVFNKGSSMSSMKRPSQKTDPMAIRAHFGEALSCYLKALKMLKGAVGAAQSVAKDLESLMTQVGRSPTEYDIPKMRKRCEVTSTWLSQQFHGVLERADAASAEIAKLQQATNQKDPPVVMSAEELIYNHSLASGRDGAVKQLLGQYDAARSCYRSAGLLAETLLMEVNIGVDDRKVLEGYVDGFAARITELDQLLLQQSRMAGSPNATSNTRGSGVIGLIGPPPSAPTDFLVGSPR